MAHVTVEDLRITYRGQGGAETVAVAGASFSLERGAALGIVGESGSGKSTIARALLGFARPGARFAGGLVRLGETSVLELSPAALRLFRGGRAAMVPQNPLSALTPHMTVGAQLSELVRQHSDLRGAAAKARALDLMVQTDLPEPTALFARYPHEISGGQRQRVVIAAALVARPELIVLDEPTTALDKTVEARVLDLVRRVQADLGASLVYVSHDLNVISAMCDRVLVMKSGEIVEDGPTAQIFEAPRTAYTRSLVQAIPRLSAPMARRPKSGPALLSIDGLGFAYRAPGRLFSRRKAGRPALDGVDLSLAPGETLGVVGESGSGKSTLASLVAGAVAGHSGRIRFDGQPLAGLARTRSKDLRRRVQMVFQDPLSSLNPTHSVEETLTRPLRLYFGQSPAAAREKAVALLAELDLSPALLSRRPRQLSGGQQQRIALARALAAEPDLLLCDEITSALDVTIQGQVLALLERLQAERGIACLFISHDLAVVSRVSDRVLVLERGQVRDLGPTAEILAAPSSSYTRTLMEAFRLNERNRREAHQRDDRTVA
ncbi:MAG: ABC transporter ATP-binding protein [Pseudomonadota bacterium]